MKALLLRSRSKKNIVKAAETAANDPHALKELVVLMKDKKEPYLASLAAWAFSHACEIKKGLVTPYYADLVRMARTTPEGAIKRNIVRIWSFELIPEKYRWDIADICFGFICNQKEPIAVRAFSVTVLQHLMPFIPEIREEVVFELEKQLPHGSAGFKVRANAFLKQFGT